MIMKTLFKSEFCEIKRTIEGRLLRIDLILGTEMCIPHFLNYKNELIT